MGRRGNSFLISSNSAAGAGRSRQWSSPVPARSKNERRADHKPSILEDSMTPGAWAPSRPAPLFLGDPSPSPTGVQKGWTRTGLGLSFLPHDRQTVAGRASTGNCGCAKSQPGQRVANITNQVPEAILQPSTYFWANYVIAGCTFLLIGTGVAGCIPLCTKELHDFQTENCGSRKKLHRELMLCWEQTWTCSAGWGIRAGRRSGAPGGPPCPAVRCLEAAVMRNSARSPLPRLSRGHGGCWVLPPCREKVSALVPWELSSLRRQRWCLGQCDSPPYSTPAPAWPQGREGRGSRTKPGWGVVVMGTRVRAEHSCFGHLHPIVGCCSPWAPWRFFPQWKSRAYDNGKGSFSVPRSIPPCLLPDSPLQGLGLLSAPRAGCQQPQRAAAPPE